MQVRAIIEAALASRKKKVRVRPEIMIPLVGTAGETRDLCRRVREVAREVQKRAGAKIRYQVGTMMEIPRACLVAASIADEADHRADQQRKCLEHALLPHHHRCLDYSSWSCQLGAT